MKSALFPRCWKAVIGVMFLVCCFCLAEEPKKPEATKVPRKPPFTVMRDVVYDAQKNLTYDLYLPTVKVPKDTPVNAILFIHGGAWQEGNKKEMTPHCWFSSSQGFVAATLDYKLFKEGEPPVTFFTMLDDIGNCLEHLKKMSAEQHYPIKSVALSGISAGGHLAMLYAYSRAKKSPIPIAMVFQDVGPTFFSKGSMPKAAQWEHILAQRGSGTEINQEEYYSGKVSETVKSISPAFLVNDDTVPTLGAYGGKDPLVTAIHVEKLRDALEAHKIPHALIVFPNSDHSLGQDPEYRKQYYAKLMEFFQKYMK
ncbi:MAG: alpha/beta hydrolase [Victivallales bacterium]|nr:alpha/beta hydrolase [Victivallales bacterium]